jgi:hypothetical protein
MGPGTTLKANVNWFVTAVPELPVVFWSSTTSDKLPTGANVVAADMLGLFRDNTGGPGEKISPENDSMKVVPVVVPLSAKVSVRDGTPETAY